MIREQVIITSVSLSLEGQVKHFQVKLPKNAKRIIGVELGWRLSQLSEVVIKDNPRESVRRDRESHSSQITFNRNIQIAEVKLQSCEEANVFYTGDVQIEQNNSFGDFSQSFWNPTEFIHQMQRFEDVVTVDGETTMLQGICKDILNATYKSRFIYLVNVYVWIEIEEPIIKT